MENPEVQVEVHQPEITDDDKLWGLLSWLLTPVVPVIVLLMGRPRRTAPFIPGSHGPSMLWFHHRGWILSGVSAWWASVLIPIILFVYQIYMASRPTTASGRKSPA